MGMLNDRSIITLKSKLNSYFNSSSNVHKNYFSASGWPGGMATNIFKGKWKSKPDTSTFTSLEVAGKLLESLVNLTTSGKIVLKLLTD